MALPVSGVNSSQYLQNTWSDNVYRASGTITAAQGAGTACDVLQITGSSTAGIVTRLLWCRVYLLGGGTATTTLADYLTLNRVTVAPTGQTNVTVTLYPNALTAPAVPPTVGTSCFITPNTTQTAGTLPLELDRVALAVSLTSSGNDLLQVSPAFDFICGGERGSQPLEIGSGKFITLRSSKGLPGGSALVFSFGVSEAAL